MPRSATEEDIAKAMDRKTDILLDVRPIAAYNGWPLEKEARGGHIQGAVPFPSTWIFDHTEEDLRNQLVQKGITSESNGIVYGYDLDDVEKAACRLRSIGFDKLRIFEGGLKAWASDPRNPMDRLPRYPHLVYAQWLDRLIHGEVCSEFEGGDFVVAHASFDNRDDYDSGHIPGAISLDTLFLEEPEHWNHRNPEELEKALLSNGIAWDTTVVLYGRNGDPSMEQPHPGRYAGQIASMRAALLLMYAGVQDVRVLDGGLDSWIGAGYRLEADPVIPEPVESFGLKIPAHPEYVIDIEEAKEYLASPECELVCMRSWSEFIGEKSGYHYIGPRGRIPGAVFGNCGSDAYHMQNYRNLDNTMLDYHEIASNWREVGIVPEKKIAFYCGTGWRASEAFFYAYLLGWERIAIYDGGWYEWSIDAGNPVETGIPEGLFIKTRRY